MATLVAVPALLAASIVGFQLVQGPDSSKPAAQDPIASGPIHPPGQTPLHPTGQTPGKVPSPGDPIVAGGSSGSCVEQYSLANLKHAPFAFDGTVTGSVPMRPPANGSGALPGYRSVTFQVREWFRGGSQGTVTVDMLAAPPSGTVSSVDGAKVDVGTRLLVSGAARFGGSPLKAPIAWSCGFTRSFDPGTAAAWR